MKEFFSNTKIKILLSVLLVLIMLSVFTKNVENNAVSTVYNSLTYGMSKVSAAATANNKRQMSYDELESAYNKLRQENAKLRAQVVDYYDTKAENTRLWKFYELKKEHSDYTLVPSTVLRRDPSDEFGSFTIDKGTTSEVSAGDPVVSESGLIGWVAEADLNTAKIVTILSPRTSIGGKDSISSDTGVVTGSAKYADQNQTTFTKLNARHKVKQGDFITTTGISGLYPKGLMIGEVTDIGYDTYDASYYAVVQPFDDIRTISDVAVITDFPGQGEILKGVKAND